MNAIILQPTDVLFFRDGRPMGGSLAGHGAAWPLPNVVNSAFHMAMHRGFPIGKTDLKGNRTPHGDHVHRIVRRNECVDAERHRRFGSLLSAGPFPVRVDAQGHPEQWLLPRPADLQDASLTPALKPVEGSWQSESSLPVPLQYAVANRMPPSKGSPAKTWLSKDAFEDYLGDSRASLDGRAWNDSDIFDAEAYLGIGIDPERQTQDGERIYSAYYLRLKDTANWRLGALAHCAKADDERLFRQLLGNQPGIVVGGQQRVCTARRFDVEPNQALPLGVRNFNTCSRKGTVLVKWVLLSPGIWPEIPDQDGDGKPIRDRNGRPIRHHPGGWLPNWVDAETGRILLKHRTNRRREGRKLVGDGNSIAARLVAAIVPKPIIVTGWSLGDPFSSEQRVTRGRRLFHPLGCPRRGRLLFRSGLREGRRELGRRAQLARRRTIRHHPKPPQHAARREGLWPGGMRHVGLLSGNDQRMTVDSLIPAERIQRAIFFLRGEKVMLDADLAALYGVETGALKRAVKRNADRFPPDFLFELTAEEAANLRCQIGISSLGHGGSRYLPYAFTEQGVAMLSSVLRSARAVQVNIAIMRAFVQLRQILGSHAELARKLAELERRIEGHDEAIRSIFEAIRQIMAPPAANPCTREIGFHAKEDATPYRVQRRNRGPSLRRPARAYPNVDGRPAA